MLTVFEVLEDKELKGSFFFLLANLDTLHALVELAIWSTNDRFALLYNSQLAFTILWVTNEFFLARIFTSELSNLERLSITFSYTLAIF